MSDAFDRLKEALSDRYAIEREIGAGGMATVYLSEDLKHERLVAIKVLRPELAAALGTDRFLQETAQALLLAGRAEEALSIIGPLVEQSPALTGDTTGAEAEAAWFEELGDS